jgi:glyoxylase-like metal-dependent hydrolase (beta-lactamase superfamily II)/ferredoxin
MANARKRLEENVPGDVFVDATCIDCGACRWIAPRVFGDLEEYAYVQAQPADEAEHLRAGIAALACPVGAIGGAQTKAAAPLLPQGWTDGVRYLGYHSPDSFGAASWLVVRPGGNVMVDTPRYTRRVVDAIAALGGIRTIFLTHRDDVGDHAKFAGRFGARRVLHRDDVTRDTRDVEVQVTGRQPVALADDLTVIPVPGHTRGSACLLYDSRCLFTGDHLAFARAGDRLVAFRGACWYDWRAQTEAMEGLLAHRFEHVLPGHGAPGHLEPAAMRAELSRLVGWMRTR